MNTTGMRVIFFGTSEYAVPSLQKLIDEQFDIITVVTAPDKQNSRRTAIVYHPVKILALKYNIPILQPEDLNDPIFVEALCHLNPTVHVVVSFKLLPKVIWDMPPLGSVNLHPSLLPQYRGAAPIQWALINGETHTGVSIFKLVDKMDQGNLLMQASATIAPQDNFASLNERLQSLGANLLVQTLYKMATNSIQEIPQIGDPSNPTMLKKAPKIFNEQREINWHNKVEDIHNLIRGLSPTPCAFTYLHGQQVKIYQSEKERTSHINSLIGSFHTDKKTFLKFVAVDGYVNIKQLQLPDRKSLMIDDFLRGYNKWDI
ncbi:MAG: methionyl-tRNA formyltransferase [Phycisphaerales bacterium]|nr:methionyl-tRNA formyltransferase [Phycisphaerales bacterium]